ncbi:NAD(P)-binding protein [Mycena kentingensis (nom. inval.)]|nr:NAD(P)-binding protein [Mycena kentingensis (nom. inval.)]
MEPCAYESASPASSLLEQRHRHGGRDRYALIPNDHVAQERRHRRRARKRASPSGSPVSSLRRGTPSPLSSGTPTTPTTSSPPARSRCCSRLKSRPRHSLRRRSRSSRRTWSTLAQERAGRAERSTKSVDHDGAVKVFDALDSMPGDATTRPRLVLVSALDVRDPESVPAHYTEEDKALSARMRTHIAAYFHWKYEADKNLAARTGFKWTMLRPGGLNNEPGTGKASIGRTHLMPTISRDDVALALFLLLDRADAAGLGIDMVGGETSVGEGLDAMIRTGETDFLG